MLLPFLNELSYNFLLGLHLKNFLISFKQSPIFCIFIEPVKGIKTAMHVCFYPWLSISSSPLSQEILHFWLISLKVARKLEHDPIAYIWPAAQSWFLRRMAPCRNRFATLMTASTSSRIMSPKKIQRLSFNLLLTIRPTSRILSQNIGEIVCNTVEPRDKGCQGTNKSHPF